MMLRATQTRVTHKDVEELLKAHVDVLMQHKSYIFDIKKGLLSHEEIADYLDELFDFRIAVGENFLIDHLPILEESIQKKLKIFVMFLKIARQNDSRVALSALYLALETELYYASLDAAIAKSALIKFSHKIQTALNRVDYLKALSRTIKLILPAEHQRLSTCISHRIVSQKQSRNSRLPNMSGYSLYQYNWLKLKDEIVTASVAAVKQGPRCSAANLQQLTFSPEVRVIEGWWPMIISEMKAQQFKLMSAEDLDGNALEVKQLSAEIDKRERINQAFFLEEVVPDELINTEIFEHLLENVIFFYGMNERFEHVLHLTKENARLDQFIKTKTREVLACKKTYDKLTLKITRTIKEFDQRARGLLTFLVRFLDQYDPHQENRDMDCLREDISRLTVMLEKIVLYADILGEKFLANMNDEFIQDGYGIFNSYITKANALVETIARVKGELTNLMAAKAKEAEEHTKVSEAEAIKQAEQNRLLSLQQQEQKSKQWKEIFEKRREEKQIIAAVAMQPVPEPPAVIVDFDQTTLMTERIKCLGTKKLWLLERLFNLEYGIRYRKLANLVKNKLGGTIEEYGSSHKRIRIGGHSALIDGEDDEGLVATGGMFKPHGKKHQPGILGPFNMKLVIATFKRAGITPELLAAVAAERQRPAASNASAVQSESTRVVICPK